MVCIPIFFGVHRKNHHLGTKTLFCNNCYQYRSLNLTATKMAAHFFFIPLFPIGVSTTMECSVCKGKWPVNDAPFDPTLLFFVSISLVLFGLTIYAWLFLGGGWLILGPLIPMIAWNGTYLFVFPSSHRKLVGGGQPSSIMADGGGIPVRETTIGYSVPAAPPPARAGYSAVHGPGYQAFVATCPYCGISITSHGPGQMLNCPSCLRQFRA